MRSVLEQSFSVPLNAWIAAALCVVVWPWALQVQSSITSIHPMVSFTGQKTLAHLSDKAVHLQTSHVVFAVRMCQVLSDQKQSTDAVKRTVQMFFSSPISSSSWRTS